MRRAIAGIVIAFTFAGPTGACQSSEVSRELGARCATSDDCDDRCLPASTGYPDGFCTVACNTNDECPTDSVCIEDDGGACLFECSDDASCSFLGDGWRCRERGVRGEPGSRVKVCRGL